jgi:hypothetical protein
MSVPTTMQLAKQLVADWMRTGPRDLRSAVSVKSLHRLHEIIAAALDRRGQRAPKQVVSDEELARTLRCNVVGCREQPSARGFCADHYGGYLKSRRVPTHAEPPPGDPRPMLRVLTDEEALTHRRGNCPAYEACLDYAVKRHWRSFSCRGCRGPRV